MVTLYIKEVKKVANITDKICKLRDILENKDYNQLKYSRKIIQDIFSEVHRNMARKSLDYSYQLEFTSQDLRELAQDISTAFKRWDDKLCPEKNIKTLLRTVEGGKLSFERFTNETIPYMTYRRDNIQILTELRSLLEYHSVFLYFLEEASGDELALKYTERVKR